MSELRIIARKPVTFVARQVAAASLVIGPWLEANKDKELSDISGLAWMIAIVAVAGAVSNTIAAWFSTSAESARKELQTVDAPKPKV